ncbi:MAG: putative metal-binding motif-containing protein, partial [Myxococcota bacterium]|nr:putative metal-binding motif-containing protein [Myxococcota bacterium]
MTRHLLLLTALTACRAGKITDDTGTAISLSDADSDGYPTGEDCDDADASTHPGATEVCDGVDNDCDAEIDEDVLDAFYMDADEDGYGDPGAVVEACDPPPGYALTGTDCDDRDPDAYPSAPERCNEADDDCDGEIDEDVLDVWFADGDGDGFGDAATSYDSCDPPPGYVADDTDCNDSAADAFPGGTEICDELDNDCDGAIDEDVTTTFYRDSDGDGWGASDVSVEACAPAVGYSRLSGDCDDGEAAVHPASTELCDTIDNDCDGTVDENDAADAARWYGDADGDGYGGTTFSQTSCAQPSGYVSDNTDCDDLEAAAYPGATESCDALDNDCDG